MSTLTVTTSQNYTSAGLLNIDVIDFSSTFLSATATFSAAQFDNVQVKNTLSIIGPAGAFSSAGISISAASGANFSAAGWSFTNWGFLYSIIIDGSTETDFMTGSSERDQINGFDGADVLLGGSGDDFIDGGTGNDSLNGQLGLDTLNGGEGDDTFFDFNNVTTMSGVQFINSPDIIDGGAGTDTANITRFQLTLALTVDISAGGAGVDIGDGTRLTSIEKLLFTGGTLGDRITGGALDDSFDGQGGDDIILGAGGNDYINAGLGSDRINGGSGDDTILNLSAVGADALAGGAGTDKLFLDQSGFFQTFVVDISAGGARADIGNGTTLTSFEILDYTGGLSADRVTGGKLADTLRGREGNDRLTGNSGADVLDGGDGRDRITGGLGQDTLTGGAGRDTFQFTRLQDSISSGNRDVIADFVAGQDFVDLTSLGLTSIIGNVAFTGIAGQVRFAQNQTQTFLHVDADGNRTSDMIIVLTGQVNFQAGDILI